MLLNTPTKTQCKIKIIAGPCQHESFSQSLQIARHCKDVCEALDFEYIFKASYDKANRTHVDSVRGLGLYQTLYDFKEIKKWIPDLNILTDVHNIEDVYIIADFSDFEGVVDIVQIPAFLCRQTDLIQAAASRFKIVNIKKGQFLAPWDVEGVLSKTKQFNIETWITERGTSFGYNTLVNDFTGMQYLLDRYGDKFVYDVTHSVQKPGGQGSSSGGNRSYVPGLCRAAAALGVKSFFLEVHLDPDNAPSDGPNMIKLKDFKEVIYDINRYSYSS